MTLIPLIFELTSNTGDKMDPTIKLDSLGQRLMTFTYLNVAGASIVGPLIEYMAANGDIDLTASPWVAQKVLPDL